MSTFMEEVMSHLQALDGADVEMTLEVQVKAPGGIDEQTARIVLANSAELSGEPRAVLNSAAAFMTTRA